MVSGRRKRSVARMVASALELRALPSADGMRRAARATGPPIEATTSPRYSG
jgi:hypothetical protein